MISEDKAREAIFTLEQYCKEHRVMKDYGDEVCEGCRDMPEGKPLEPPPENYEPCIFKYKDYCALDCGLYGTPNEWDED
jgi:hypothetical protein